MEVPARPDARKRGMTGSRLTIVYLSGFFVSLIVLMLFYMVYAQWFVDLLTPSCGFDKAFDLVTWFTPLAWLIIANLAAVVVLFLATLAFPLTAEAKEMLYGKFTQSMLLAVVVCLISLVVLDIIVYVVDKELKIVELVPLVLLAFWFFIKKNVRNS